MFCQVIKTKNISRKKRWCDYGRSERHAPWKILLPLSEGAEVLAVGLKGKALSSLGRSWKTVHAYKCCDKEVRWAREQAEALGEDDRIKIIADLGKSNERYSAIAINGKYGLEFKPNFFHGLLVSGGMVIWVGNSKDVPSASDLYKNGYDGVRSYGLMPPKSQTSLIPISSRGSTSAALDLLMPGTSKGRIMIKVSRLAAKFGCQKRLASNRVVIGQKQGRLNEGEYLQNWIGKQIGGLITELAVYVGWERLVVQLLDDKNKVCGILKFAETSRGKTANEHEEKILNRLQATSELDGLVPRILHRGTWQGKSFHVQSAADFGPRKYSARLTPFHIGFLKVLSQLDRSEIYLNEWPRWQEIKDWINNSEFTSNKDSEDLKKALSRCEKSLNGLKIPFHRVHGDFNPWNIIVGSGRIMVVDWEESQPSGLPYSDLLRFITAKKAARNNKQPSIQYIFSLVNSLVRTGFDIAKESLATELALLAAVNECWTRYSWWQGGNLRSSARRPAND